MVQLAIIADDLTGALDAAAPFAGVSGGVVVATRPESLPDALAREPDIISVSTRSRETDANTARSRVARVLEALPADVRLFKKVDSRLKGNIAAELEAFGEVPMLVAPAIPEFGRVVRKGVLQGFGVNDPIPVISCLGSCADHAELPDTTTSADMVSALKGARDGSILVGARGLAMALASSFGVLGESGTNLLVQPVCFAIGSTDPITLRQIGLLRKSVRDLDYHEAQSGTFRDRKTPFSAPLSLFQMTPGHAASADIASKRFASAIAPWLRAAKSMVLSGGATAEACLDAIGIELLTIRGEILPGLPISEAGGQLIVTKSGGFGDADTLASLALHPAAAEA